MMNSTAKIVLITVGVLAVGGLLFFAGTVSAQRGWLNDASQYGMAPADMMGAGRMGAGGFAGGMMNGAYQSGMAQGMMIGGRMGGGPGGGMGMGSMGRQGMMAQVEPEISEEEALQIAQSYLDENQPGAVAEAAGLLGMHGIYHFTIQLDGESTGMLMVDGVTSEVFEGPQDCPWLDQDADSSVQ
jgi:hypothetical protein